MSWYCDVCCGAGGAGADVTLAGLLTIASAQGTCNESAVAPPGCTGQSQGWTWSDQQCLEEEASAEGWMTHLGLTVYAAVSSWHCRCRGRWFGCFGNHTGLQDWCRSSIVRLNIVFVPEFFVQPRPQLAKGFHSRWECTTSAFDQPWSGNVSDKD